MNFTGWSRSPRVARLLTENVGYGRRLVSSAIKGARTGEGRYLGTRPSAPNLGTFAKRSLSPAVLGVFMGACCGYVGSRRRSATKALVFGCLGGAIGFSGGIAWGSRRLTASVASGVRKSIRETRDEHWLEKNPIDYA